jgi:hypothetical protein
MTTRGKGELSDLEVFFDEGDEAGSFGTEFFVDVVTSVISKILEKFRIEWGGMKPI